MKALYTMFTLLLPVAVVISSCVVNNITVSPSALETPSVHSKLSTPSITVQKAIPITPVPAKTPSRVPVQKANLSLNTSEELPVLERYRALDPKKVCLKFELALQRGTFIYDNQSMYSFAISSGRMGLDTPSGTYYVTSRELRHPSTEHNCILNYALNLGIRHENGPEKGKDRGIFFHEGRVPKGKISTSGGYPTSHRCIRAEADVAKKIFGATPVGAKVVIEGSAKDYYKNHFEAYNLLTFDDPSGKPRIKREAGGTLTPEFINYVKSGKMEIHLKDRRGNNVPPERGVLCFEFMDDPWQQGVPVVEYEKWRLDNIFR